MKSITHLSFKGIIKFCLLLFFFLVCTSYAKSQENSEFFDDGVAKFNKGFKTNLFSDIFGEYNLRYEQKITHAVTVELSAGYIANENLNKNNIEKFYSTENGLNSGYMISGTLKRYSIDYFPERFYWGYSFENRHYNYGNYFIRINDISYNFGYQFIFNKKFLLDLNSGIGFRFLKKISDNSNWNNDSNHYFAVPIGIKVGFILN